MPIAASDVDVAVEADFRTSLRSFLASASPGKPPRDAAGRVAWQQAWAARLYDGGYAGPAWPQEYGGMDLPFPLQVVYQEELARARVPGPPGTGVGIAGPTIIRYGNSEQKERYLRPLLRGDEIWVQGYSEPDAGSDLPALRTTARREGDDYVVSGQKVWTTQGQYGDIIFTLVRTGSRESRQHGISYLLIDARAPGVRIRPLRDLTGGTSFGEVFFDEVRVPVSNRIGEENGGWPLVRTSLGHERAAGSLNQATMYRRVLDELRALAKERGAADQPWVRTALTDFEMRTRMMRYSAMRVIDDIITLGEPGAAASTSRLYITTFEQDLHEFAVDMLGAFGALDPTSAHAVERGRWVRGFLSTRASTIGAGTAEIQRNTIAEQVLGMPHDPAMPAR